MLKILILSVVIGAVNLSHTGYYEVLGVTKQASTQEIRQAYKKLAIKYHPDKSSDTEDQKKFIEITEAYETLKDPEKRKKYDLYGSYQSYTRKYDYRSQAEYNNLFYNGLYHEDPNVETLSGRAYYKYLGEGFHFINFYSPFCPPCQNLVDHWKKLAEVYKGIIKIGAVNCKYHNSFCYNSMRIGSYPTLLFYPNGKQGNFIYYRGEHTFDALSEFVTSHVRSRAPVPAVARLRSDAAPAAYVLGSQRIEHGALARIAYLLKGLVTVMIVEDEDLRATLTKDEYTTVVFSHKGSKIDISSTDEKIVIRDIVDALPRAELVGPDKLKEIRNQLRSGYTKPWALYFSFKGQDRLVFHQMRLAFPDMHFGEVDCERWGQLCASLQAPGPRPAWGVLKPRGAYQRGAGTAAAAAAFLQLAPRATRLHTLSEADLARILAGQDLGTWVLVVVPHQLPWSHTAETFTRVSLQFLHEDIDFGIMTCTSKTDKYCLQFGVDEPTILVQRGAQRQEYGGEVDDEQLVEFIQLVLETEDIELDEQKVVEVLEPSRRRHSWLLAFLPPRCQRCRALAHHWRRVAGKLRPLDFVRVGMLQCQDSTGFCSNIRSPTARLYPLASNQHYTISLQHVSQAPYIWEWALGLLVDSVQKLNWHTFSRLVVSEDLNLNSNKKPWLVYFHSPRCFRCYEMYADFAIAGILLDGAVELGTVNCVSERNLCQHEHITSYPSLRLYLPRSPLQHFSSVSTIKVADYASLLKEIKPQIALYKRIDLVNQGFHMKHDEF